VAVAVFFFSSCIKQVSLNLRAPTPQLVVEGLLLTDSTPCKVILSYSGIFNSVGGQVQNFINDATVFVKDGLGDSTQLLNVGNGTYMPPSTINATVGVSYSLAITLSNGKRYISIPETIPAVPRDFSLDTIAEGVPDNSFLSGLQAADVQIKTQDPANEKNYYRWINTAYISREATGEPCCFACSSICYQYCFQYYPNDTVIRVLSDDNINGTEIRHQNVLLAPYYTVGTYYILVKQLSLTQNAYEFWKLYNQQTNSSGGILDPLPASLQGNIYNANDSTDVALGYFEASDAVSLRLILSPVFINPQATLSLKGGFIGQGACASIYPNTSYNAPPGWENAQQIIYNVY